MIRRLKPVVGVSIVRAYRVNPHIYNEIEELAETQKAGRWGIQFVGSLSAPMKKAEVMCDKLNLREQRRSGQLPEKAQARKLSQAYQKDGKVCEPEYVAKKITITVVGFDGHPYIFRLVPMPDMTLNMLIDGSGMCYGYRNYWERCSNPDCIDPNHNDGCQVNVDLETLDRLPPPGRFEHLSLEQHRSNDRPDIQYNTRFSCQLRLTEELDGALFALKNIWGKSLRTQVGSWGETDIQATISSMRSKRIEPWAPILEEPTKRSFPITLDMFWSDSYQEIMLHKYPNYRRTDGFHSKPQTWAAYV